MNSKRVRSFCVKTLDISLNQDDEEEIPNSQLFYKNTPAWTVLESPLPVSVQSPRPSSLFHSSSVFSFLPLVPRLRSALRLVATRRCRRCLYYFPSDPLNTPRAAATEGIPLHRGPRAASLVGILTLAIGAATRRSSFGHGLDGGGH